jgi:hypothetical protein
MLRDGLAQSLLDLGRVGRRGTEHHLHAGRQRPCGFQEMEDALLVGDAPDVEHVRRFHSQPVEVLAPVRAHKAGRIDAVVDHDHLRGIDLEVPEDVLAHLVRDGDDAVRRLHRRALDPSREQVARAELVRLPWSQRLHAVERDDERNAVQRPDPEARHVRVPRMRVRDVGVDRIARHRKADRQRLQRRRKLRLAVLVCLHPLPWRIPAHGHTVVGRRALAEAPHLDVHAALECLRELIDDHSGATVDMRRILAREHQCFHAPQHKLSPLVCVPSLHPASAAGRHTTSLRPGVRL